MHIKGSLFSSEIEITCGSTYSENDPQNEHEEQGQVIFRRFLSGLTAKKFNQGIESRPREKTFGLIDPALGLFGLMHSVKGVKEERQSRESCD